MGFIGFYRAIEGFHRVLSGFAGFYWVLPGFTGFERVERDLLDFIRFERVIEGFYRVLLGFTERTRLKVVPSVRFCVPRFSVPPFCEVVSRIIDFHRFLLILNGF